MLRVMMALLAAVVSVQAQGAEPVPPLETVLKGFDTKAGTVQHLAVPSGDLWAPFVASADLGGQMVELELYPHRVRSADEFRVQTMGADGKPIVVESPAPITYSGTVPAWPGSRVRASLVGGKLTAVIWTGGGDGWTIQPVCEAFAGVDPAEHVVYRISDTVQPFNRCGVDEGMGGAGFAATSGVRGGGAGSRGPTVRLAEVAFDVDFEYYTLLGSNTTSVVNDIESIMNVIEGIYEGESVNTQFEVTVINIRTANAAPYLGITNASTLLSAFQNEWAGANPALSVSAVKRDTAHMFTNKAIDSGTGTIGIAYLSGMCRIQPDVFSATAIANGLSKSRWSANTNNRASVTAHEIGHNMSATHCNQSGEACTGLPTCQIMCASVGGCGGSIVLWGACTAGQIIAYRDSSQGGCLGTLQPPITTLPFLDNFPSGGVSAANWAYNFNCAIGAPVAALQPAPSPLTVLTMNAIASIRDEIRTNFINLSTAPANTEVSFRIARNGVPAGATFYVDYWANNLRWVQLDAIVSDGVTPTTWALKKYTLPAAGRHAESRIRFRLDTITTSTQNWYVDDARVGTPLPVNCNLADITEIGGTAEAPGNPDNQLTVDDIIVFTNLFSDGTGCPGAAPCSRADVTGIGGAGAAPDGQLTVDDIIEFFNAFSDGCP